MKLLIITGNEIRHNYFVNQLKNAPPVTSVHVLKFHSGKNNYEFFYPKYSAGAETVEDKNAIVKFIFERDKSFTVCPNISMLFSTAEERLCSVKSEFNLQLEDLLSTHNFDYIFCYGAPIIDNTDLLEMKQKVYNLHLGLSRFYRGGFCNLYAMAHQEYEKVGLTCHELTKQIDGGDILFEITDPPLHQFDTLHGLDFFLVNEAASTITKFLTQPEAFELYRTEKGPLIPVRDLKFSHVIAAESNLRAVHK